MRGDRARLNVAVPDRLTSLLTSVVGVDVDGRRLSLSWARVGDHALDEASFQAAGQQRLGTFPEVRSAGPATTSIDPFPWGTDDFRSRLARISFNDFDGADEDLDPDTYRPGRAFVH